MTMNNSHKKIFILHGWTYSTSAWDQCITELKAFGYDIVMLNVPGLTEPSDKVWTLEAYTEWLKNKLYGQTNVILMGHSNGGRIALSFASKYPEQLSHLILVDAAGIVHNEMPLRIKRAVFGSAAKIGKKLGAPTLFRKIFYKLIRARDYARAPENMRETMKNLIAIDLTPILSNVRIPTLIIWGQRDSLTPISDAYVMNKGIKDSRLFVIPDAAHSPQQSHPQILANEANTWLSGK